jgi:cation diffusion facilitator family transporter
MVVEIVAGYWLGSMALLADGWHMASHAAAFAVSLFAYHFSQRHSGNPDFSFGTWKIGVLAGYTSAVLLAVIGLDVLVQSTQRIFYPQIIDLNDAFMVAIAGLFINGICAVILYQPKGGHSHAHDDHGHDHDHHHHHHHDLNHRSAFIHVLSDAVTSVTAIAALALAILYDWQFLDAAAGILGGAVILLWAAQLVRQTGSILTDHTLQSQKLAAVRQIIESDSDNRITDFHIWQIGPSHFAAIIAIVTHVPKTPDYYKSLLRDFPELVHISIEINGCDHSDCSK